MLRDSIAQEDGMDVVEGAAGSRFAEDSLLELRAPAIAPRPSKRIRRPPAWLAKDVEGL